LRTVTCF